MCAQSVYFGYMTTLNIRIDEDMKVKAGKVLKELGMDMSSAVKMFLQQIINIKALPFTPVSKSAYRLEIEKEIAEALKGPGYKSAEEMHRAILGDKVYENWK